MKIAYVAPDDGYVPFEGLMAQGAELKTALANSELRLAKSALGPVSETTTLAELDAQEADFQGYVAGGITITAFNDPYSDPTGEGVLVVGETVQFNWVAGAGEASNTIGAAYLVDSTGKLRGAWSLEEPVTMSGTTDSIPFVPVFRIKN